ncbi:hypothetical protein CXG81DRAFT_13143 [Caulochytrium protostelioides]|uniref:Uncharacterized protein n=1 Tax=Caulochytrium protostelioides TaxID=1555241 RepID=A0A4P9X5T6_9FUNG|nr:hypothetical protein CXG81DRAFT_13143 [Caulochytrium protostelioides]|eukprot:RKP00517.1 hypothetical protein CXG81DRAFT_13143 [Caulochytrium protostelioides]
MTHDTTRDPCPYAIVYDVGVGFSMGAIGGSVWHGFKGYRNSPRGYRFSGLVTGIKTRAPVLGGNFAVWSGLFNTGDCLIAGVRGTEDAWNPILAGAGTGAILAARSGKRAMLISAAFGGVILAVMEGVGSLVSRLSAGQYAPQAPALPEFAQAPQMPTLASVGAVAGPTNADFQSDADSHQAQQAAMPQPQQPQQQQPPKSMFGLVSR